MSALVVERAVVPMYVGHLILSVHAVNQDADADQALSVAGVLARVALNVSGALEATAQDHGCRRPLYRDDDAAEVVDAQRFDGCRLHICEPDEVGPPSLTLFVPPNRERAWIAYLERAISELFERDRRELVRA